MIFGHVFYFPQVAQNTRRKDFTCLSEFIVSTAKKAKKQLFFALFKKDSTAISSETKRRMAKRPENFSDRLMMLFQNFNILESKSGICIPCQAITMDGVSKK